VAPRPQVRVPRSFELVTGALTKRGTTHSLLFSLHTNVDTSAGRVICQCQSISVSIEK
jgi:hypothetical protein